MVEGKRVVTMFDYYEKREHSLLVLEYLQVPNIRVEKFILKSKGKGLFLYFA